MIKNIIQISPVYIFFSVGYLRKVVCSLGGLISLWDMDLSIEVTKRGFKMFHPPLKCWSLLDAEEANVGGLLLAEGAHITVVPVVKLPPPGLLQLFQDQDPIGEI